MLCDTKLQLFFLCLLRYVSSFDLKEEHET